MSSADFVSQLRSLGYGKRVSDDAVSWVFDYPATKPMLEFLCKSLSPASAVTEEELVRFNELQTQGSTLHGSDLDDAMAVAGAFGDGTQADDLEREIAELEEKLGPSQRRLNQLISQRDQLSSRLMYLNHRTSQLVDPTTRNEERSQEQERAIIRARERVSEALDALSASSGDLISVLEAWQGEDASSGVSGPVTAHPPLLGQTELAKYTDQDRTFLRELNMYFKKQFHEGVPAVLDKDEVPAAHIYLDISEPTSLLIKGQSAEVYKRYCDELARLRAILPTSYEQHTAAVLASARAEAAVQTLQEQAERDSHYRALGLTTLRQTISEMQQRVAAATDQLDELRENVLPSMYRSLADLEAAPVLHGDYELKIKRQDYHLEKQDFVAKLLLGQLARHKVLLQALEAEESVQRQTHHLLSGIVRELNTILDDVDPRLGLMDHAQKERSERKTIDERDATVTAAYEMLTGERTGDQAYVRNDHLIDAARELISKIDESKEALSQEENDRAQQLSSLRRRVETLSKQLFTDSTADEPSLTPVPLRDVHQRLEKSMQSLAQELDSLMKDRAAKQDNLAQFPDESRVERNLFVALMTAPDRLRTAVQKLQDKVAAHAVQASTGLDETVTA